MEKILVTGGAGFIGSTLANFYSKDNEVFVIDDLSMGRLENLEETENLTFFEESVTNIEFMEALLSSNEFDYIFHLAAIASVADSVKRPIETHEVNFRSVLELLELTKKYQTNLKRLVFSSSAAVYGDEPTIPKHENSQIHPMTPYAIDKFSAEKMVLAYCRLYGVPTSAVRFFNVYGPKQNPNSPYSGVISILVDKYKQLLNGDSDVSFTLFGDGEQSRDFVYVDDVVQSLNLIARSPQSIGEVYNVGTGQSSSLNQLIRILNYELNIYLPISYDKERKGDVRHSLANINKLRNLGYKYNYHLYQGIKEYWNSEKEIKCLVG